MIFKNGTDMTLGEAFMRGKTFKFWRTHLGRNVHGNSRQKKQKNSSRYRKIIPQQASFKSDLVAYITAGLEKY